MPSARESIQIESIKRQGAQLHALSCMRQCANALSMRAREPGQCYMRVCFDDTHTHTHTRRANDGYSARIYSPHWGALSVATCPCVLLITLRLWGCLPPEPTAAPRRDARAMFTRCHRCGDWWLQLRAHVLQCVALQTLLTTYTIACANTHRPHVDIARRDSIRDTTIC